MQLSKALVELSDRLLARLDLPAGVLDAVMEARRVRDPSPKNRALRVVRIALRAADAKEIQERLRDVHAPPRHAAEESALERWRARLLDGGENELGAYLAAHPEADRRRLRQLVQSARRAKEGERAEKLRALTRALSASFGPEQA